MNTSLVNMEFYTFAQYIILHDAWFEIFSLVSLPAVHGQTIERF